MRRSSIILALLVPTLIAGTALASNSGGASSDAIPGGRTASDRVAVTLRQQQAEAAFLKQYHALRSQARSEAEFLKQYHALRAQARSATQQQPQAEATFEAHFQALRSQAVQR